MEGAVSKGEFAAIIGVTPGRISQYIAAGKITPAALIGIGRNAKIDVERAKADLRGTLDISQRLGNGIDTRLDPDLPFDRPSQPTGRTIPPAPSVDNDIKAQKLEQLRRINRNGAIAEAQQRGQLVDAEASRAERAKIAGTMLQVFEGGLAEIASAISAEYKVPQRDILHLMRKKFRDVRAKAAEQMRKQAVELSETVETELAADDIESLN
ncbi:hypothetical protein [Rhizobium sp. BK602]|uniref:hypothetical protein n=1 Tax=Rhizobium sp. BK602 TaxID=2586986 RepID=UPI001614F426|nr:hypothetical protein [Rhizobium sp. BK602]MBB3608658.1 hypothetical protein [Rhizobium sp. BK602]